MWPLPGWLIEALNGTMALLLPWVIVTSWRYMRLRRDEFRSFWGFYHNNKMAIALTTMFIGLEVRSVVGWVVRHFNARPDLWGGKIQEMISWAASPLFTIGSVVAIAGAVCWARVANDMPIMGPRIWTVILGSAGLATVLALASPY